MPRRQHALLPSILVPTARLELARLAPLPPQDSVSTNFTTSAIVSNSYLRRIHPRAAFRHLIARLARRVVVLFGSNSFGDGRALHASGTSQQVSAHHTAIIRAAEIPLGQATSPLPESPRPWGSVPPPSEPLRPPGTHRQTLLGPRGPQTPAPPQAAEPAPRAGSVQAQPDPSAPRAGRFGPRNRRVPCS